MKAITVKYLAPAAVRSSRLKAFDCDGNSVTISYPDHAKSFEFAHFEAVKALCAKMKWSGEVWCGWIKGPASVWVFPDRNHDNLHNLPEVYR